MEQLLTANVATNLYWLGRYIERVEETLLEISSAYDKIIDVDKNAGAELYKQFDIDIKYDNALNFLNEAILGEHNANLADIMGYARENAIICRSQIAADVFGEIIELHGLFQSVSKSALEIDYKFIDQAQSLISEIWGGVSKREHRKYSDYFIRLGQLVEEGDLNLRLNRNDELTPILIDEIDTIIQILAPDAKLEELAFYAKQDKDEIINMINNKIEKVVVE